MDIVVVLPWITRRYSNMLGQIVHWVGIYFDDFPHPNTHWLINQNHTISHAWHLQRAKPGSGEESPSHVSETLQYVFIILQLLVQKFKSMFLLNRILVKCPDCCYPILLFQRPVAFVRYFIIGWFHSMMIHNCCRSIDIYISTYIYILDE